MSVSSKITGLWESPVREDIWGYFGGRTTKIPPYLPLTPAIPRELTMLAPSKTKILL